MNTFEKATLNTLDRDYEMRKMIEVLGPDPNYWPATIREWAVEAIVAALNTNEDD